MNSESNPRQASAGTGQVRARHTVVPAIGALLLVGLAGCSSFVDKPVRATLYDFGPGQVTTGWVMRTTASCVPTARPAGARHRRSWCGNVCAS
jgi:hypothetical protein